MVKKIASLRDSIWEKDYVTVPTREEKRAREVDVPFHELPLVITALRREMKEAAGKLEYERAAEIRDRIKVLELERLART